MGTMGSGINSASPGPVGRGVPVPAARMERTSRGPPPSERHRPLQSGDQRRPTVGGLEGGQLAELDTQTGDSRGGRAAQERLGWPGPGRRTPSRRR